MLRGFGSVLGLVFEHQNPNSPVQIKTTADIAGEFNLSEERAAEIRTQYTSTETNFSEYDKNSIMVLDIPRSMLTNPKYYVSANSKLSSTDIAFISSLYPLPEATLHMTVAQASINMEIYGNLEIPNILYIDWGDDIKQNDSQSYTNVHTLNHQYKDGITEHTITIYGAVTVIYCSNNKITEFEYVKVDTNLLTLICPNNKLAALDVSLNQALVVLNCNENPLTSLQLNSNISTLQCQKTLLSDLNLSIASNLHTAYCDQNENLQNITVNNPDLKTLYINNNKLTSLNVSGASNLTILNCSFNKLSSLDVNSNTKLSILDCGYNDLTTLNLDSCTNLTDLRCSRNLALKEINVSTLPLLRFLFCDVNDLSSLDVSHNTELADIICDGNKLTALDISQNTKLRSISCHVNAITELDLSKCPDLQSLTCSYNPLSTLDFSQTPHIYYINCTADDFVSDSKELINIARTLPQRDENAKGSFIIGDFEMKMRISSICTYKNWLVDQMYSGVSRSKSIMPKTQYDELYKLSEIRPGFFVITDNIRKL